MNKVVIIVICSCILYACKKSNTISNGQSVCDLEIPYGNDSKINPYDIYSISMDSCIEGNDTLLHNIYVFNNKGTLIYLDTMEWFELTKWKMLNPFRQIYYNDSIFYILFPIYDPVSNRNILVCSFQNEEIVEKNYVMSGPISDIDGDGLLEIVGRDFVEAICLDCDTSYYNPYEVYKFAAHLERDLFLDSIYNTLRYGIYINNWDINNEMIIVPIKGDLYYNGEKLPE